MFEDDNDVEVECFSDYQKLKDYLETNTIINFIVCASEENAKRLLDHIHSIQNVIDVFVYSR